MPEIIRRNSGLRVKPYTSRGSVAEEGVNIFITSPRESEFFVGEVIHAKVSTRSKSKISFEWVLSSSDSSFTPLVFEGASVDIPTRGLEFGSYTLQVYALGVNERNLGYRKKLILLRESFSP